MIPAASDADVMTEQLELMLEHVATLSGFCGCAICQSYPIVWHELLGKFEEPNLAKTAGAR